MLAAMRILGRTCGLFGGPAGVTVAAGIKKALQLGLRPADATVVGIISGNGLKDVNNAIKAAGEPISIAPSMDLLLDAFSKKGFNLK